MLTFTKRGKFASRDELWVAWRELCRLIGVRRLRSVSGDPWAYVAVPELHDDGVTFHLHVGVKGLFDVVTLRALWERALGGRGNERGADTHGNVDAQYFKGRGAARKAWAYIGKYVGKGLSEADSWRKAFARSADIAPLRVDAWHHELSTDIDMDRLCAAACEFAAQLGLGEAWVRGRWFGQYAAVWFEAPS